MKILDALAKNISTQTLKLEFIEYGQNWLDWTDTEQERLVLLLQRNTSISHWMTTPNSIPLSVWPHVSQSVQKTGARSSLVFQSLRRLAERFSVRWGWRQWFHSWLHVTSTIPMESKPVLYIFFPNWRHRRGRKWLNCWLPMVWHMISLWDPCPFRKMHPSLLLVLIVSPVYQVQVPV
jgi:hypothetical protein